MLAAAALSVGQLDDAQRAASMARFDHEVVRAVLFARGSREALAAERAQRLLAGQPFGAPLEVSVVEPGTGAPRASTRSWSASPAAVRSASFGVTRWEAPASRTTSRTASASSPWSPVIAQQHRTATPGDRGALRFARASPGGGRARCGRCAREAMGRSARARRTPSAGWCAAWIPPSPTGSLRPRTPSFKRTPAIPRSRISTSTASRARTIWSPWASGTCSTSLAWSLWSGRPASPRSLRPSTSRSPIARDPESRSFTIEARSARGDALLSAWVAAESLTERHPKWVGTVSSTKSGSTPSSCARCRIV